MFVDFYVLLELFEILVIEYCVYFRDVVECYKSLIECNLDVGFISIDLEIDIEINYLVKIVVKIGLFCFFDEVFKLE